MAVEIERKFLVRSDAWRAAALDSGVPIRQGYLACSGPAAPSVRVRLAGPRAMLTIKGPGLLARQEFEYPIPPIDAQAMLDGGLCTGRIIEKLRTRVAHAGLVWEVDVFGGHLAGLVLAEVELSASDQAVALPDWVGAEVSRDGRYQNGALARAEGCPAQHDMPGRPLAQNLHK